MYVKYVCYISVMALTAAERAKRYREKLKQNPEKFEEQRKKHLERLKKSRKTISELTQEDKECRRKQWREEKKKQKAKKNKKENEDQRVTPSSSKPQNSAAPVLKIRYKKICRSYRGALENIRKLKVKNETIRKKLYREKLAHEAKIGELQKIIDKLTARQEILEISLRETYCTTQSLAEKRLLKSVAVNQVVKTNRSVKTIATCLGLKGRIRQSKKKIVLNKKIQEDIKRFYLRDDISRNTAGKRETKTRGKKKMQIRYLTDTLQNLYEIYKKEGGTHSFTTLFRYKPYYVLSPTAKTRDTCMCVKHSNMEYLFIALKNKNVIEYKNLEETINKSVCDKNLHACMYELCVNCNNRSLQFKEEKNEDEITWFRWDRVTHTYQKSEKNITTKKL